MQKQTSLLFDIPDSQDTATGASTCAEPGKALRLTVGKGARLSPMRQRFNRLLARIEKLKGQMAELQTLEDAYLPQYSATLMPLQARTGPDAQHGAQAR